MHPCRDRFLMNQMMRHGKNPPNLEFVNSSEKYSPNPVAAFSEVAVPDEVFLVFQRWPYLEAVPVIRLYNAFLKMRWIILNNCQEWQPRMIRTRLFIYITTFCDCSIHIRFYIDNFNVDINSCKIVDIIETWFTVDVHAMSK